MGIEGGGRNLYCHIGGAKDDRWDRFILAAASTTSQGRILL